MQPGTKQRQSGTKQGQPGTTQGQPGTKQGQPGTKKGQGHNWTNAPFYIEGMFSYIICAVHLENNFNLWL